MSEQSVKLTKDPASISRLCKVIRYACFFIGIVTIIIMGLNLVNRPTAFIGKDASVNIIVASTNSMSYDHEIVEFDNISYPSEAIIIVASILPFIVLLFILRQMERLFYQFQEQNYFSINNIVKLKSIAMATMVLVFLEPAFSFYEYSVFSSLPHGMPIAPDGFEIPLLLHIDLPMLIIGAGLYCIALVLGEALNIKNEIDYTI